MGKNKVLVKISPEGKYVVSLDKSIKIEDFRCNLPKDTFKLAEWAQLCHDNPQYLSVNDALDLEAKV